MKSIERDPDSVVVKSAGEVSEGSLRREVSVKEVSELSVWRLKCEVCELRPGVLPLSNFDTLFNCLINFAGVYDSQ